MSSETRAPDMSGDTKVKVPIRLIVWLIGIAAAGAMAWGATAQVVASNTRRIEALEAKVATDHELLVRIDENVRALKEAQGRRP